MATFDRTLQKTHMWLNELSAQMAWDDEEKAYAALRATLHALRDRLPPVEAAELGTWCWDPARGEVTGSPRAKAARSAGERRSRWASPERVSQRWPPGRSTRVSSAIQRRCSCSGRCVKIESA